MEAELQELQTNCVVNANEPLGWVSCSALCAGEAEEACLCCSVKRYGFMASTASQDSRDLKSMFM